MSSMAAREQILGRLRAAAPAAAQVHPEARAALDHRIDQHYEYLRGGPVRAAVLVQRMQAALGASRADVLCATADAWPALLAAKIADHGVRRLLLDPGRTECAALMQALPAGTQPLAFEQPLEAWKSDLFSTVDAGFTVARSGIAATGTLILEPDRGTPRSVSLAPPLHIALVYASTLHADMHAAVQAERWHDGMPTNLVLASGPSKTSDIQQTLAYGAHGPRWMWVVIVLDAPAQGGEK
jgi:L-lactate dehydrogenase complex protein LldG